MAKEKLSAADKKHGYTFGCEGLMSIADVSKFLDMSHDTVDRRCAAGLLRKGKHPGGGKAKVGICRRSVKEYLSRMEL